MFKFAPRFVGFISVMLILVACISGALGISMESTASGLQVLLSTGAGVCVAVACLMLPFTKRDDASQLSLRRLLALSLCFGFMALVIMPTQLNPAHSLPYLIAGAAVTAIVASVITPRHDLPTTTDGLYIATMGIPLVAAVLAWKIGIGPLWDAYPALGGLAAFSVTALALGLVYGLQGRVPEFPVREVTV